MTLKKIKEELRVRSIKNGSVIDHITAGNALNVLKILDIIGTTKAIVSVAMNVTSKRLPYGRKDIVKIEDRELNPAEVDKIALIAPQATINIIRDYEVVQKNSVVLPNVITHVVQCPNLNCISNSAEPVYSKFKVLDSLELRCSYCETIIDKDIAAYLI
jgi:aspartate carbamoyltransferase regulatory subunit